MRKNSLLQLRWVLLLTLITTFAVTSYARAASLQNGYEANPTPRITQQVDSHVYMTLYGNTRPEATAANYRGPVEANTPIEHMLLFLKRSPEQEAAINQYIESLNEKGSPNFHKWLTPEEYGQYGVADEDIDKVTTWLQSQGFTINQVYANKMAIDITGTAGAVQQAFRTQMVHLEVGGESHIANWSNPQVPTALAPVIRGFASLNDFRPHANHVPVTQYTFSGCSSSTAHPIEPGTCYAITPQDNAVIYNLNPLWNAGYSGQGQTIAVVEDTDTYGGAADWNTYRSTFGLSGYSGTYTQVHPNCADPGTNGDDGEAAIDVEVATGIAPSAAIQNLSCPSGTLTFGGQIALQNLLNTAGPYPGVVSVSYGVCEAANGNGGNAAFYTTYQQAAAQGISVFTSSGDEGASGCSRNFSSGTQYFPTSLGVSGWGGTPYDVSVGGTDFEDVYNAKTGQNGGAALSTYWNSTNSGTYGSAKSYVPEIPWNDACGSVLIAYAIKGSYITYGANGTGFCNTSPGSSSSGYLSTAIAGGGASNCATGQGGVNTGSYLASVPGCQGYSKPSFQTGATLTGGNAVYGVPSDGVRDVPDVSMFAANGAWSHFETVCWSDPSQTSAGAASCAGAPSSWSGFGGTSVSSPTMAAIQALVNQKTGQAWGVPLKYYYQIGQNEYGTAGGSFQGSGCNSSTGSGSGCVWNDVTQGDIDAACRYNGTTIEHHCYKPTGTNGVASTDNVTGATVINGGTGYTSAPTCTIAGPSNANAYKSPQATTLWAGGTQATCTATVNANSTTAVWTVTMSATSGVGDTIVLSNNDGSVTCGPYTLSGTSTTLMASGLVTSIGSGCSLATATSTGAVATLTARNSGYAGNFITNFGNNGNLFQNFYVYITNTALGQGPNYVSGITINTAGTGYAPETPITLTGGGGSGAIAVANTTPGTPAQSYQPAYGANAGYDLATGLGSPNAYNLVMSSVWGPVQQPCPITFPNPGAQTYGVAPFGLNATDTCSLPITYSVVSGPATVSGSTVTITGAGTVTLKATQPGSSNYLPDTEQVTFSVSPAVLTVTANNAGMTYGGILPTLTYNMTGFVNGDTQGSATTGQPSEGTTATSQSPTGAYPITITQGTLAAVNYTFQFVNGTLTIGPATLTVTADNKTTTEGNGLPPFTASYSGFVNGDNQSVLSGAPAFSTDAPAGPPVGTWNIFVAQGTLAAQNYTFTFVSGTLTVTASVAQITAPTKGSTLSDTTVTFQWTHETGGSNYQVWAGSTAGASDLGYCGTSGLSCSLSGLPNNGSTIYVTLYGFAGGQWTVEDSAQYTAVTSSTAQITSPTKGSTLSGNSITLVWTAEGGATAYQAWAGSTAGASDLGYCGTSTLTCTINGLPDNGQPIYITLYGLASGWTVQDTATYNAASPAQITSPTKGSTLAGSAATFTWTAETGATVYQLWLGSTPGGFDIDYSSTSGLQTSFSNLPTDGRTIYATLYGYANGVWSVQDTATYTAATQAQAQITSPAKGSTLAGDTQVFTWSAEDGGTNYQLWVGSAPGGSDYGVQTTTSQSATVSNLPTDGSQVYVTLYGYAGSNWTLQDSAQYTAAGGAPGNPLSNHVLKPKH